ncbi:uncharacterized protein LOC34624321, partial [Cyclospora cayetanensis]|uniref:Uncharacterized protein LOC34624321 n=1 Tax=Cyclospora cayetanensis TaxID=88456 RepID=A0A6P6RVB3_9EIME
HAPNASQNSPLALPCGESQVLLQREQGIRFLSLLLACRPVLHVLQQSSPAVFPLVPASRQLHNPRLLVRKDAACIASHPFPATVQHVTSDASALVAAIDKSRSTSSSGEKGLVYQWGEVWLMKRQHQRALYRQRERLLRCFFLDLNDSSAAFALPIEAGIDESDEPTGVAGGVSGSSSSSSSAGALPPIPTPSHPTVASAASAAAANSAQGPSRAQLQKMRRRAKQEVLKIDKQRRIELVKQGKSAYELRALAAAEELSREFRMRTPLQEFLLTAAEYGGGRQRELLQRLNVSFDADFVKRQIHQREHGQAARGAPLLHVKAALQLYGVSPVAGRRARVAMLRFHRPDIRSSFANPTSRKRGGVSAAEKPWIVLPPVGSEVLRRNSDASFVGAGDTVDFESTVAGSMPSQGVMGDSHPSLCFYSPKDLTLSDDCPFVVLEHTEQQPFIVNNPGMSLRVTRYVRPLSAPLQGSAASAQPQIKAERIRAEEERLQGSLGTFGDLRLVEQNEKPPSLFGTDIPLERGVCVGRLRGASGEGQAVVECSLFSALVFPHPQNPQFPPGPEGRFNDPRRGDFLLIRRRHKDGWRVRQLQPKVEVPAPQSKKLLDERKLQSKAWALRYVRETGVMELKRVKELMKSRFCPPVIEKEVAQLLKQLSPIAPHRLPVLPESSITSIISPEAVCALESSHAAWYRLRAVGIVSLTTPDGLSSACAFVEAEERKQQQAAAAARRRLRQLQLQQQQRREALGLSNAGVAEAAAAEKQQLQQLFMQFSNSRAGRRYSPLIRFIEELLLSVPWQTTKECREVLQNKGSAQFLLTGFGDPSCGRGEGITLLKRGSRIRNSNNPLAVQQATRRQAAGGIAGTVDDLRKLGMMELRARLLQYGLSDAVIRTLPRWDQVALVRQYRDGFGAEESSGKGNRGAGTRLPAEEYEAKLASILKRQQAALRADLPVVTDTEDEMQTPPLQLQQLTDGASTAAAGPNPHQQLGAGEDVADALFAGCEDSDHEQADEAELEMRELQVLRDRQEARSQRPLTQEEQLRAEATVRAVPCLRWTRKRRQQVGDSFTADRCILIYGAENIKAFLAWRDQRLEKKRQHQMSAVHTKEALAGKRVCRACGRPGHIASNVNCPLYRGPKRLGSTLTEPMVVKKKKRRGFGNDLDLLLTAEPGLEGGGSLCSASAGGVPLSPSGRPRRGESTLAMAAGGGSSESSEEDSGDEEGIVRGGAGGDSGGDAAFDSAFEDEPYSEEEFEGVSKAPKSTLSRSSRSLTTRKRSKPGGGGGAADGDRLANSQQPLDALNVAFARVVNLLLQQQSLKPFVSRVDDRVAPGYSVIVKKPMFLRKILSKCRERQYTSVAAFKADIDLIVSNCFLFNPPGSPSAWLRDRALQLQQLAMQRVADQPQIAMYEAAMAQTAYQVQQQQQPHCGGFGIYDD